MSENLQNDGFTDGCGGGGGVSFVAGRSDDELEAHDNDADDAGRGEPLTRGGHRRGDREAHPAGEGIPPS